MVSGKFLPILHEGVGFVMFEPNMHRMVTCENCGARFKDDCGDAFCSYSCEREWERENEEESDDDE